MPLYEYRCDDCCHGFEVLQSMGEGCEGITCPQCKGSRVARQLSTFSGGSSSGTSTSAGPAGCSSPFT